MGGARRGSRGQCLCRAHGRVCIFRMCKYIVYCVCVPELCVCVWVCMCEVSVERVVLTRLATRFTLGPGGAAGAFLTLTSIHTRHARCEELLELSAVASGRHAPCIHRSICPKLVRRSALSQTALFVRRSNQVPLWCRWAGLQSPPRMLSAMPLLTEQSLARTGRKAGCSTLSLSSSALQPVNAAKRRRSLCASSGPLMAMQRTQPSSDARFLL